jgi:hypothetical protein
MESTVNKRIKILVDQLAEGNKSSFARSIGISNQSLGEIIGGRQSAPSFAALQKIFISFPQVRMEWLILGSGPMLRHETGSTGEAMSLKAQIDASELRLAQEMVTITAAKLARQKQMMELLDQESMRLTAQKADIAEKQAAGHATPEDTTTYQQLNAQWLQVLEEKKELSSSIDFGTTLLSEQQAEYIELINQQLGIEPPDSQG